MSLFEIDESKCKRDGICAAECPMRLLEIKDTSLPPTPIEEAEERCIRCGHCVAVCPHGAFSLSDMRPGDCPPVNKGQLPDIEQTEHFLRSRRSIRTYLDREVEREKLARLIDIARYAPTGTNSQQVKWLVINSREGVKDLAGKVIDLIKHMIREKHPMADSYRLPLFVKAWDEGTDRISRGAPSLVIVHAPAEYALARVDCAIALTFLDLAAPSLGLGTCWAGFFMLAVSQWPPVKQALALPEGNDCFGAMMIGYPKYTYRRLPLRKEPDIAWHPGGAPGKRCLSFE